jgi:aldehyde:ferredoxin oxidoreductase
VEEKGMYIKELGANKILRDALPVCVFVRPYKDSALMAELVSAIIGEPWTVDDLVLFGERVMALERLFNMREAGLTRDDDVLPERITREPKPDGPNKGYDKMDIEVLKDAYYKAMGYDLKTGNPSDAQLAKLGIDK